MLKSFKGLYCWISENNDFEVKKKKFEIKSIKNKKSFTNSPTPLGGYGGGGEYKNY